MKPVPSPNDAERKVLRWLMAVFGAVSVIGIAFVWWSSSRQCQAQCVAAGASAGVLDFRGGGRLNMGVQCHCERERPKMPK